MPSRANAGVNRDKAVRLNRMLRVSVTPAGQNVIEAADAAAQRDALELGTAATESDAAFAAAVHTHAASDVTSGTMATARLGSGTANSSTFLRGDQSWASPTASVALNSTSVAFTDGDTIRRVTVTDASVGATDKILCSLRRPDTTDDSEDAGHLYFVNVVRVAAGSFDAVVVCCDRGMGDTTEQPPSETIQLVWTRAA